MKKSELKALIREVVEETHHERNVVLLREFFKNDLKERGLNEGVGDFVKTKMVQPIVNFLLRKLKSEDPERSEMLSKAVEEKDKETIKSLFDDPKIKSAEKEITNDVVNEYATRISEESDKPSLIKSITSYIKNNPKLSTVVILALLGLIGAAVYGSGGVVPLLIAMGKGALGASKYGAIGGAVTSAGKSIYNQTKDGGNIKLGQLAKDTAKGAAIGTATAALGGALTPMLGSAAKGIADLGGIVGALIKGTPGEAALGRLLTNPNIPDHDRIFINKMGELYKDKTFSANNINNHADALKMIEKWANSGEYGENESEYVKGVFHSMMGEKTKEGIQSTVSKLAADTPKFKK